MRSGAALCAASILSLLLLLSLCPRPEAGHDVNIAESRPDGIGEHASLSETRASEVAAGRQGKAQAPVYLRKTDTREVPLPGSAGMNTAGQKNGTVTFPLQDKPDLTVVDTWTVPGTFCRYAVVDIHSTVGNLGTVSAVDSFYFDMWFDGENIGFARIESLAAGQTLELILENFAWPGDTLSHVVTAMADTDHEIDEELETNNIHLEYFAADLCTTCTFVTLPFQTGWNWFSLNVDDPDMSLDHVLASLDTSGVYIKNQTAFAEYVPEWSSWFGTLTSLTCHDTYMIRMAEIDTLDFCGFPYDVCTPLSLPVGWSWVSYLPRDSMGVDDALESLGASGEYIKNQTAFAEYVTDWSSWFGTLTDMCPGEGYKIRMAVVDTLVYPDSVEVTGGDSRGGPEETLLAQPTEGWTADPHDFETNLCLIAEVCMGTGPCAGPGDRLGAFRDGECRGVSSALRNPDGRDVFYLTIHGHCGSGEMLSFRYLESSSGRTYDIREALEFRPDITVGSSLRPMALDLWPGTGRDNGRSAESVILENRPDPFTRSTTVRFRLASPGVASVAIYGVRGERVVSLCEGYLESGTHSFTWQGETESGRQAPGGIYFCRLVCRGGVLTEKMVLMK